MVKASSIADKIRDRIRDGGMHDGPLTSRELAREFDVNPKTVNKALRGLVSDGLLVRIRGKGTFVRSEAPNASACQQVYAVCGQIAGHMFQNLSNALFQGIRAVGYIPMAFDLEMDATPSMADEHVRRIADQAPEGIVVIGTPATPYESLYRRQDILPRMVFVLRQETDLPIRAAGAISDYWYGAYLATRHLIEQGHERILFLTHERPGPRAPVPQRRMMGCYEQLDGYQKALREDGDRREYVYRQPADGLGRIDGLAEWMCAPEAPTAIIADSDYRLVMTLKAMEEAKIGAGLHTPCVGFFNTPWVDWLQGGLTSVSIREQDIADHALRLLQTETATYERVDVKPELIVRASSTR